MKTFRFEKYGKQYEMKLEVRFYENGNLAIPLCVWGDDGWENWSVLTVNLEDDLPPYHAYININDNGEGILAWILRNGLAAPTGKMKRSGYCQYPEYRFRPQALREADPDGYEMYMAMRQKYGMGA